MSHIGKAIRLTDPAREIFQFVIPEPIPTEAKYLLLTKDGYLMVEEEVPYVVDGKIRIPQFTILSYTDIEIED